MRRCAPAAAGARKVVLATNIAETSLTIAGRARRGRFGSGAPRALRSGHRHEPPETQRISRASAEQRQGRAGRTAPGVCYRAWSEGAHGSASAPSRRPRSWRRILRRSRWSWPPGARAMPRACAGWIRRPRRSWRAPRDLLRRLGALDAQRPHQRARPRAGAPRRAPAAGTHAARARVQLEARAARGRSSPRCSSERDLLRGGAGARDADVRSRLELLRGEHSAAGDRSRHARARAPRRARARARQVARAQMAASADRLPPPGVLLAFAYPDRIGAPRPAGGRYQLANGRGADFAEPQALARQEFIVAVDLDDSERDARILLAAPLTRAGSHGRTSPTASWRATRWHGSRASRRCSARRTARASVRWCWRTSRCPGCPRGAALAAMLEGVRAARHRGAALGSRRARPAGPHRFRARATAGRRRRAALAGRQRCSARAHARGVARAVAAGITRREHLARLAADAGAAGTARPRAAAASSSAWAPTHLAMPTGSRIRVDYQDAARPCGRGAPAGGIRAGRDAAARTLRRCR